MRSALVLLMLFTGISRAQTNWQPDSNAVKYSGTGVRAEVSANGKIAFVFEQEQKYFGTYVFRKKTGEKWVAVKTFQYNDLKKYAFFAEISYSDTLQHCQLRRAGYEVPVVEFDLKMVKPVKLLNERVCDSLHFSEPAQYEVFDKFGKSLMKGFGRSAYVKKLKYDAYYVNMNSSTAEFIKSKKCK